MNDRPLSGPKVFSTTIATTVNDLPTTSPRKSRRARFKMLGGPRAARIRDLENLARQHGSVGTGFNTGWKLWRCHAANGSAPGAGLLDGGSLAGKESAIVLSSIFSRRRVRLLSSIGRSSGSRESISSTLVFALIANSSRSLSLDVRTSVFRHFCRLSCPEDAVCQREQH